MRPLIKHSADVNTLDGNRETHLHLTSSLGMQLLIEHGADGHQEKPQR
jgi:hypothetical protein